jgi:CheY-like chemotaxis protein
MAKVLIVDDDAADGELTQRRLAGVDAEVHFHHGARGAYEKILEEGYAVVVLDVNMPGITGLQVLTSLRMDSVFTKVLLFSSMEEEGLAQIAKSAGVQYLTKGASKEQLVDRVQALLGV